MDCFDLYDIQSLSICQMCCFLLISEDVEEKKKDKSADTYESLCKAMIGRCTFVLFGVSSSISGQYPCTQATFPKLLQPLQDMQTVGLVRCTGVNRVLSALAFRLICFRMPALAITPQGLVISK